MRITTNSNHINGVPCTRGLRIPVAAVVVMVADGMAEGDLLTSCSDLEREDISEALHYAAEAMQERDLPMVNLA